MSRRSERLDTESLLANAIPLPAAFLFAWLVNAANVWILFGYLLQANAHESGHTIVSWLSGRFAMMIPIGLTLTSLDKSFGVGALVFLVLLALGVWGAYERRLSPLASFVPESAVPTGRSAGFAATSRQRGGPRNRSPART
jgi:hypothetical protein